MTHVSWNRQAILAAILLVLGGGAVFLEYKYKPQKEQQETESKQVFHLKDTQIQSIRLFSAKQDQKMIQLICSDMAAQLCKPGDQSKWELSEPLKLKADDSNSNSLVSNLNHLNPTDVISLKDESPEKRVTLLKEYGLDPSQLMSNPRIEVKTAKGTSVLYLGANHPIQDGIFAVKEELKGEEKPSAKIRDEVVYLLPTYLKNNLEKDLTHWRNKKLFTLAAHEVGSFQLESSNGSVHGQKKDTQWTMDSPTGELSGDPDQMGSLLSTATLLSARSFASENKTDALAQGLLKNTKKVLTLTLVKETGAAAQSAESMSLTLYEKPDLERMKKDQEQNKIETSHAAHSQPKNHKPSAAEKNKPAPMILYATVSNLDPLFVVDSYTKERLMKSVQDLRLSKLITTMQRFSAQRLEFTGGALKNQSLSLSQKAGKWTASNDDSELDSSKVQKLLDRLSQTKILSFLSAQNIPSGSKDGLKLTLGDDKNPAQKSWVFWSQGDQLFAQDLQSKTKEAFVLQKNFLEVLPQSVDFFKKEEQKKPTTPEKDQKTGSASSTPPETDV